MPDSINICKMKYSP